MTVLNAPPDIGGTYQSYLQPNGLFAFVHIDAQGNTTNEPVSLAVAAQLTPRGWIIIGSGDTYGAYKHVSRVSLYELLMDERIFNYKPMDGGRIQFYIWENEGWNIVRNESWIASLSYFLRNEGIYGS